MKKMLLFFMIFTVSLYSNDIDNDRIKEKKLILQLKNNVPKNLLNLRKIIDNKEKRVVSYDELLNAMSLATSIYLAVDDPMIKLKIVNLGYGLAKKAMKKDPNRGDGYFYAAQFIGFIGILKGVQYILNYLPQAQVLVEKAIEINPNFQKGTPYMLMCAIYYHAPGFPISIGNIKKANKYCLIAREKSPKSVNPYLYLATIEDMYGYHNKAKKILKEAINNCSPVFDTIESRIWYYKNMRKAKKMLQYLNEGRKIKSLLLKR